MYKKFACAVALLCCVLCLTVFANGEFYVYGEDNKQITQVFNMPDEGKLKAYCEDNKITYLAVNADNTKQIRRTEFSDAFSEKIADLSVLSDDQILKLSASVSGFENTTGKIVKRGDLKFLKIELKTEDGGGEYVLTQYITVSDSKKIVLSFYTDLEVDRDYIQSVFEKQFPKKTNYEPFIIIGLIVFAFVGVVAGVLIVKELRKKEE